MGRILIGIVLGLVAALACLAAAERLAAALYPVAPGIDLLSGSGGQIGPMLRPAKLILVAGWCLGTLIGGGLAARIGHREIDAYVVAAVVVSAAMARSYTIVHPSWIIVAGLLLPWSCAWAVRRLAHLYPGRHRAAQSRPGR